MAGQGNKARFVQCNFSETLFKLFVKHRTLKLAIFNKSRGLVLVVFLLSGLVLLTGCAPTEPDTTGSIVVTRSRQQVVQSGFRTTCPNRLPKVPTVLKRKSWPLSGIITQPMARY